MTASSSEIGTLVVRVQSAFLDAPWLTLSVRDVQRRFAADEMACEAVLALLVDAGVLTKTPDDTYARRIPRPDAWFPRRPLHPTEHAA
jgi:hypothetical protein